MSTKKSPVKKTKEQASKPEEPQPEAVEPKLSDIKLMLDALTATILDHTRQIAELQETLARKRKPVPNGKVLTVSLWLLFDFMASKSISISDFLT